MEYVKFYTDRRHERTAGSVEAGAFIASVEVVTRLMPVYLDGQAAESYGAMSWENPHEHGSAWGRAAWLLGFQGLPLTFANLSARVPHGRHVPGSGRCSSRALVDAIVDAREAAVAVKAVAA